jgi:hypothetical protein
LLELDDKRMAGGNTELHELEWDNDFEEGI